MKDMAKFDTGFGAPTTLYELRSVLSPVDRSVLASRLFCVGETVAFEFVPIL
jgi:hypothetical protein